MKDRQFLRGEFIGNSVIVCDAGMKEIVRGRVVWETKNMMHIGEPEKRFSKKGHNFIFETEGGRTVVEGRKILYRPEDRIKRLK
jgi:ribonuclease P protein subunit POP4